MNSPVKPGGLAGTAVRSCCRLTCEMRLFVLYCGHGNPMLTRLNCRGGGGGGRRGRPSGSNSKSQAAASNLQRGAEKEPSSGRGGRKPGRGRGSGRGRKPQHMVSLLSQQSILQVNFSFEDHEFNSLHRL